MYLPFQSNCPSFLDLFALFSAFIFTRFAETLSFFGEVEKKEAALDVGKCLEVSSQYISNDFKW